MSLTAATVATNSSCTFSTNVTAATLGNFTNTTGTVSSTNGGTGNTASANLDVAAPPTVTKSFGVASMPLNGSTLLTFTITNPTANTVALTGIAFTDALPIGLAISAPNGLTGTCGGGSITATAGSGSASLSGATLPANASCTFSVNVTATATGALSNTTGTISSTQSGAGTTSNTANITILAAPTIAKSFGAASAPLAATTSLTFIITNPNSAAGLTGVAFTDSMPSGLTIATPNGVTGTCGAGIVIAAAGGSSLSLSGGTIAASSSCTFSVNVTAIAGGNQINTTGSVSATNGGTGNTASATITVLAPDLTVTKSHTGNFKQGQTGASYTITVSNVGTVATSGAVTLTDTLPAGLTPTAIAGTGWTCALVSVNCTRSDALAGRGSYPAITLTVNVSGVAPTSLTNIATVSGGGDNSTANNSASDVTTINVTPPDFSVTVSPSTTIVKAGLPVTFTFTMTPLNNVPFPTPIALTVMGMPANTTYVFEPSTLTPGTSAATSVFVMKTTAALPYLALNSGKNLAPYLGFLMPLTGLALSGLSLRKRAGKTRNSSRLLLLAAVLCGGFGLYGCASATLKIRDLGTPPGNYIVTVTCTSGSLVHAAPVTVTVQP